MLYGFMASFTDTVTRRAKKTTTTALMNNDNCQSYKELLIFLVGVARYFLISSIGFYHFRRRRCGG